MQLAQSLKAAGLAVFPCAVRFDDAKQKWAKAPLTVNKEHWAATGARPIDDPAVRWQGCKVPGVVIPRGVVILDLDTYKPGVSTDSADSLLGCGLPWAAAHIQTTISGGNHYAFRLPDWPVRQGSNLGAPNSGLDTRVAQIGFICTGKGYSPDATGAGLYRLTCPESLPVLPDACRGILEAVQATAPVATDLPEGDRDVDVLLAALAHIDPAERDVWRDTGFALKHYFHDDEATGYAIWDRWSSGEFTGDTPVGYAGDTQAGQWEGFKAQREGATITIGSLFHAAAKGGWQPPARFDASLAFGASAAPAAVYTALVDRILEQGTDSRHTEGLMQAITTSGCNELQALLLRNELKAALRSAKLLDKTLAGVIDRATAPQSLPAATAASLGMYGKNHTENAQIFLHAHYPEGTLLRSDEVWFEFDGKCWAEVGDAGIDHKVAMAMLPSLPQRSEIVGTLAMLGSIIYRDDVRMTESPEGRVVFQNGVLDLHSGQLHPHDKRYLTTKIVPYNFNPNASAPRWLRFLDETLEGDAERIALLQEWLGYMLSPSYEHHKIMLLLGPRRCGKGTIGHVMEHLVGTLNFTGCSLSSFADDDYLDSLRNKTVAFSGDTQKSIGRNIQDTVIERMKKISGGDAIDFKRKYKSRMSCVLPPRFTLATNSVPRLFDDSEALSGRMLVLPFEVSFLNREDHTLRAALLAEIEGIAIWSLQGMARLNAARRFTVPAASVGEMQFIAEMYSPLRTFIDARCALGGQNIATSIAVYDAYCEWATTSGEDNILLRKTFISAFKDAIRGRGCTYGEFSGDKGFKGITLRPSAAFAPSIVK